MDEPSIVLRDSLMVSVNVPECKLCRSIGCDHCNPKCCNCEYVNCTCEKKCICQKPENCTCIECKCINIDHNNRTKPLKISERPPDTPDFLANMPEDGLKINDYFKKHKIHEFFHFLMCHLLATMPDNPIEFLMDLLDKIHNYSINFELNPPLLFQEKHIVSLYNTMDPLGFNCINYNQYYNGLITLGVNNFTTNPPLDENQMITKDFFGTHAKQCLILALNDLLSLPDQQQRWSDISEKSNVESEANKTPTSSTYNETEFRKENYK